MQTTWPTVFTELFLFLRELLHFPRFCKDQNKTQKYLGPVKTAHNAALRQAKFYIQRQGAAATL